MKDILYEKQKQSCLIQFYIPGVVAPVVAAGVVVAS